MENNSKRSKFVAMANKRVPNALNAIRLVANLANKQTYDYSQEDVKKIFKAFESELTKTAELFSDKKPAKAEFSLE